MNKITINGKTIICSGNNVTIDNGKVIVDGEVIHESSGDVKAIIDGDVKSVKCEGAVEVRGSAGTIDCGGSCTVLGNVKGSIDAGGSVTFGNVGGDIDAGGSVMYRE